MKRKKPETESRRIDSDSPAQGHGRLKSFGGSVCDDWNEILIKQVGNALWLEPPGPKRQEQIQAAVMGLAGIEPRDEIEGMLAAQMIAAHHASMECFRRAMIPEQFSEARKECLNQANKLSRTFCTLLEALNRYRGKGQQKVTVEHVHVHAGGQAIVGHVERSGGGGRAISEEQSHAKQITDAPEPPLRCEDKAREPVPVTRDDER
ncbi:hypothetical protein M1105_05500 [Limibaculum sp. FT325]|uniref:hypothetical protein n=1 Tax=Thermohalobaculum sediminis TaxID=2939436 RepID=UPI0020C1476F|nr:hypothetical protein [Limibaculum sediminis]MCL5776441.1 hypothetical protein [Limibaculum sediminis]